MTDEQISLPPHVEHTLRAVEQLQNDHHRNATRLERVLEMARAHVSYPWFIFVLFLVAIVWVGGNLYLHGSRWSWDPPPFSYLQLTLSAFALFVTILILATQRRADQLSSHREQLILQLAYMSEQKTAKIIALLEEMRRDSPQLSNRADPEAEQMTATIDPRAVSDALRQGDGKPA